MKDKQIVIDYKNLCENYSKEVGCYHTFDGSCSKEECFTYRLMLKLEKIKEIVEIHKDEKCAVCPKFDECFEHPSCDNVILQIIEDKANE